jgi:hypothetical protein
MPEYVFKNKETGELRSVILKISELDQYKEDNPDWVNQIQTPSISSGRSTAKPDSGFRELLRNIKDNNRGSNIRTFD